MKTQVRRFRLISVLGGIGGLLLAALALRSMVDGGADRPMARKALVKSSRSTAVPPKAGTRVPLREALSHSSVPRNEKPVPAREQLHQLLAAEEIDWAQLMQLYASAVDDFPAREQSEWINRFAESLSLTTSLNSEVIRTIERRLPGIPERVAFAQALAGSMSADQFPRAGDLARGFQEIAVQEKFLNRIGRSWARNDVLAAAHWANSLPPGTSPAGWVGLIDGWAEQDPDALLAWAQDHGLPHASASATGKLARRLALTDPSGAVALSNGLLPSAARTQALGYALNRWASQEPRRVMAWVDEQTDDTSRDLGRLAAARALVRSDPAAAAEWMATWKGPRAPALRKQILNGNGPSRSSQ